MKKFGMLSLLLFASQLMAADRVAMDAEVRAHRAARAQVEMLRQTDPQAYVDASIAWIEKLHAIGERHRTISQSAGVRGNAVSEMMKLAAFVRSKMRQPRLAIDLYRRAAKMQQALYGGEKPIAMNDWIADIEQFDLGDRKAAAAHLRELLVLPRSESGEFADYNRWTKRWLEAEIAFLEEGRVFDGSLSANELAGFAMHLFYGAGGEITNGEPIDRALNPFSPPSLAPAEMDKALEPFPPSHSNFLRHCLFAVQMSPGALRTWLVRNDPAGFWRASFLSFGAIADRRPVAARGEGGSFHVMLVRKTDGSPTALALLAREYAKTHVIPASGAR